MKQLYANFDLLVSHMEINRIDFYKLSLWNKIRVLYIIKSFITYTRKGKQEGFKVFTSLTFPEVGLFHMVVWARIIKKRRISQNENIK